MNHAFRVAKRVRTETRIGENAVSVGHVAVELSKRIFRRLSSCVTLLVGAGKMGEICARSLDGAGVKDLLIVNRSYERAAELAEKHSWQPRNFGDLPFLLEHVDIVIVSTGSRSHVVTQKQLKTTMSRRRYRPLFIIDISVPRNVHPDVNRIENVYLYDIDDLEDISRSHLDARSDEAAVAETLVRQEVEQFQRWLRSLAVTPTIELLQRKAAQIQTREIEKTLKGLKDLNQRERDAVEKVVKVLVESVTCKILHDPIVNLRQHSADDDGSHLDELVEAAHTLFNLPADGHQPSQQETGDRAQVDPSEEGENTCLENS